MMLPLGPLPATPGASRTASFSARPTGRRSSASFLKLAAIVAVGTRSVAVPVTVTLSLMEASARVAFNGSVSAIFTLTLRVTGLKPCRSNVTW